MRNLINGLVTKGEEVAELKSDLAATKRDVELLEDVKERLEDKIEDLNRLITRRGISHSRELEDERDDCSRSIELIKREIKGKVEEAKELAAKQVAEAKAESALIKADAKRDIARAEDSAEQRVRRVKEESKHRENILTAQAEREIAIVKSEAKTIIANVRAVAEDEAREEFIDEIDGLKDQIVEISSSAAAANAASEEKDTVIKALQTQTKSYDEFVRFAMTKLPNVDLSKFQINVDVPAPQVVTTAGQKGGEQKKK